MKFQHQGGTGLSTYLSVLDVLEYLVYGNVKVLVIMVVKIEMCADYRISKVQK